MIRSICQSKYLVNFCAGHKAQSQEIFRQFLKNQSRLTFATTTNVYSNETEDNKGIEEIKNTLVKDYQKLPKFSHNEACGVVFRLAQMSKSQNSILSLAKIFANKSSTSKPVVGDSFDELLQKTLKLLTNSSLDKSYCNSKSLVFLLNNLRQLKIPNDAFVVQNIKNALLWKCRSSPIPHLLFVLSYAERYRKDDEMLEKLFNEVIRTIEMRWVEFNQPDQIQSLLHNSQHFSDTLLAKVEDLLTTEAENLSSDAIVSVLKGLATKEKRPRSLLKALTFHLTRRKDLENLKLASDALYSCAKLSIKEPELIEILCINASKALVEYTSTNDSNLNVVAVLRSIMNSLGKMGFFHEELFDQITKCYVGQIKAGELKLAEKDLLAYLMTTATVNYCPNNSDIIYELILKELTTEKMSQNNSKWLNVVWHLSILGKAQKQHFESILSPFFTDNINPEMDVRHASMAQKVLLINAIAKHLAKDYKGSLLSESTEKKWSMAAKKPVPLSRTNLVASIFEAFHSLASPPNFILKDVKTKMGFRLDAEAVFTIDEQSSFAKPLGPIQEMALLGREADNNVESAKALPSDAHRIAVLILDYNECIFDVSSSSTQHHGGARNLVKLSGSISTRKNLLETLGYKVLQINYDELKGKKVLEQIKHLEGRVRKLLKE